MAAKLPNPPPRKGSRPKPPPAPPGKLCDRGSFSRWYHPLLRGREAFGAAETAARAQDWDAVAAASNEAALAALALERFAYAQLGSPAGGRSAKSQA